MATIKQSYLIKAPVAKVWQALVDPKMIDAWGGGPAKMSAKAGDPFSLWGGDIRGKNIEVSENKKLIQEWVSGNWPKPSKVTFTLIDEKGKTKVELLHVNVPDEEEEDIADGWDAFYLGEIKKFLEGKEV